MDDIFRYPHELLERFLRINLNHSSGTYEGLVEILTEYAGYRDDLIDEIWELVTFYEMELERNTYDFLSNVRQVIERVEDEE